MDESKTNHCHSQKAIGRDYHTLPHLWSELYAHINFHRAGKPKKEGKPVISLRATAICLCVLWKQLLGRTCFDVSVQIANCF